MKRFCAYTCGHTLGCGNECEREATHVATVRPHLAGPLETEEMFICGPHALALRKIYGAETRRIA